MIDFLHSLSQHEGGKRLILNIYSSIRFKHIDAALAFDVLNRLKLSAPEVSWHPYKKALGHIIFADPEEYQFKGPAPLDKAVEWVTIKSMGDLLILINENAGHTKKYLESALGVPVLTAPNPLIGQDWYIRFAQLLSNEKVGLSFLMAKTFDDVRNPPDRRPSPSWYSHWHSLPKRTRTGPRPSEAASGRIRDWLGLPYEGGEPLFAIRTRAQVKPDRLFAYHPTVFDGFDNPFYKHNNTVITRAKKRLGSAVDLAPIRSGKRAATDVEGGPEVVSRGIVFDPTQFVCEYLGVVPLIRYSKDDGNFHACLMDVGLTIDEVILGLHDIFSSLVKV